MYLESTDKLFWAPVKYTNTFDLVRPLKYFASEKLGTWQLSDIQNIGHKGGWSIFQFTGLWPYFRLQSPIRVRSLQLRSKNKVI